jgi:nuclear pore complex protein Nup54
VAKLSALSTARNSSLRKEEEELRVAIEGMAREAEEARSRGNELWSGVGALKAKKASEGGEREWAVVDEEGLRQVLEVRCFSPFFAR